MNLKQNSSIQAYSDRFDEIMCRVQLSEEYTVSCFLSGLKEEIQYLVRMFASRALRQAISLAKLQELTVENASRMGKMISRSTSFPLLPNPKMLTDKESHHTKSNLNEVTSNSGRTIKYLTTKEMDEIRKKSLCFWC